MKKSKISERCVSLYLKNKKYFVFYIVIVARLVSS